MWSVGVITYILLCGYPPFYEENNHALFQQIMQGKFEFDKPFWDSISVDAKDFVSKLLVVDPKSRLRSNQALHHPFLTRNCEDARKNAIQMTKSILNSSSETNLAPTTLSKLKELASRRSSERNLRSISLEILDSAIVNEVKLLSYSICMKSKFNFFSDYKNSRLQDFMLMLPTLDICCLQDIYGSTRVNRLIQQAKQDDFDYCVSTMSRGLLSTDDGLLILSKYPIQKQARMSFKKNQKFISKGCLYARIEIKHNVIHLFNLSLQKSKISRMGQLNELLKFIWEQTQDLESPIILCGLFEVCSKDEKNLHSQEYEQMMKTLSNFKDLLFQSYGGHPTTYGDINRETKKPVETLLTEKSDLASLKSVDYVFLDPKQKSIQVDARIEKMAVSGQPYTHLSDHYAIKLSLSLK